MVSLFRSFLIFISIFIYFDDQSLADESISFDTNINAPLKVCLLYTSDAADE